MHTDNPEGQVKGIMTSEPETVLEEKPGTETGATERLKEKGAQLRQKGVELKDQMKDKARGRVRSVVSEQAKRAASELDAATDALRQAGQNLRERDKAALSQYADKAAVQIERLSHYLHEKDFDQFVDDAEDFVRRRPLMVIGGVFVAGIALARFFKASREEIR
jgi:ElaB/YqjD/DUF883 family membrane-anchored ribosome-binding protein